MTPDTKGGITLWRSTPLQIIAATSLIGVMGVSLISPVLPGLRDVFGVSDAQVGLVITVYTLPGIVLTPFVGLVADRVGRRRVIVPLLFVFGVAGAAIAVADAFATVLALRFIQGIGASALIALSVTLIGDLYEGSRRNTAMGINGSAISTGAAFYPVIGGVLATIRWNAPFAFFGVGIVVGVAALLVLEEPSVEGDMSVRAYLRRMFSVIVLPEALVLFVALFSAFVLFYGAVLTAMPLLLSDDFGLGADTIGLLLSMVAVASAFVSWQYGRLADRISAYGLVAIGFICYGFGLVGIRFADTPVFVGAMLLVFGVGFGVVMPSLDTAMVTLVSEQLRAGMMGVRTSMIRLGQTIGPVAFTFTADAAFRTPTVGYRTLVLLAGGVAALAGFASLVLVWRRGGGA